MTRDEIDIMWNCALRQAIKDGEQFTRYHFAALVADAATKYAPDYKTGYADGVYAERKANCAIVYGLCISDNNAAEIVKAIMNKEQT